MANHVSRHLLREFIRELLVEHVRKPFHIDLPVDLIRISDLFKSNGRQLYVVGGAVRDALMGKVPKDYDVATDAAPNEVEEILSSLVDHKVLGVGKSFGVINVITPEGNEYEIATFRKDIGKGRRPDAVEFTSIDKDVMRRDLTINALFYDIDAGEVVDYVGGIADIEGNVVKAVGNPAERFDEDRLRILRALRFAGRMGSELDPVTSDAIKQNNSLSGVSPERVRDEFVKSVESAKDVQTLLSMYDVYDMWDEVFPGLRVNSRDAGDTRSIPVLLALLLDDNDVQLVAKRLNALRYSAEEVLQVSFLMRFKDVGVATAYKLKKQAIASRISDDLMIEYAHTKGKPDERTLAAFIEYVPSVTGAELQAAGFTGQALGQEQQRREALKFQELLDT